MPARCFSSERLKDRRRVWRSESLAIRERIARSDRKTKRPREFYRSRLVWRTSFIFCFDVAHSPKRMTRFYFSGLEDRMIGGGWDLEGASWSDPLSLQPLYPSYACFDQSRSMERKYFLRILWIRVGDGETGSVGLYVYPGLSVLWRERIRGSVGGGGPEVWGREEGKKSEPVDRDEREGK